MCGIAGTIGVQGADFALAAKLRDALRHRGPDDEGIVHPLPSVYLIHTRLSILDLSSAGHQPMTDAPFAPNAPNWVTFNGEIYNFAEIASDLSCAGYRMRSKTDTEVILHSYRRWGESCVERFRGMFAICLLDLERGVAYLWRDRLGIKPLYLFRPSNGGLIFASESRAILAAGPDIVPPVLDRGSLEGYFAQGAIPGDGTMIRGLTMLPPATSACLDIETGRELARRKYWHFPAAKSPGEAQRQEVIYALSGIARQTVRDHLISDVPLGLFLSGGIDSTALLTLARDAGQESLRTLTVGFDCESFDESLLSSSVAKSMDVRHQTIRLTGEDVLQSLDDALFAMDNPTVDGFNTYFVSRAARDAGLTVALSGLGGDEVFAGYDTFTRVPQALALRSNRFLSWSAKLGATILHTRGAAKASEAANRAPDALCMYLLRRELFLPAERRQLQDLPLDCDPESGVSFDLLADVRAEGSGLDETNRISLFELQLYMRHMLLRDADAFSMAAPIEYRVPFLDHVLVETVFALPGEWKRPDPRPKPLLLDIASSPISDRVWNRPKQGFTFPWSKWLAADGALHSTARDAVHDCASWRKLDVDPAGVLGIWNRFEAGDRRVSPLQVLAFMTLRDFTDRYRVYAT